MPTQEYWDGVAERSDAMLGKAVETICGCEIRFELTLTVCQWLALTLLSSPQMNTTKPILRSARFTFGLTRPTPT